MEARIAELNNLIEKAKEEIEKCKNAKQDTVKIVEDSSNCVKELDCVSSNLAQGIVLSGKPLGNGVKDMTAKLNSFSKSMEANIAALDDRIKELENNIISYQKEIDALRAEIQRLAEEEEYKRKHPVKGAIKGMFIK